MFFFCFVSFYSEIAVNQNTLTHQLKMVQIMELHQSLNDVQNILNQDTEQDNKYYSNKKCVRDAAKLALNGILTALQEHLDFPQKFDFNLYHQRAKEINPYMAKVFANAYDTLTKCLIEDGNLNKLIVEEGLREAKEIVDWCEATKKTEYTSSHS
jgi:hypothetical protein